ncbi:MAG: type I methionyl aminopeptidase [Microgenomates group bacterium]
MRKKTDKIIIKTPDEIKSMATGGRKLGKIRKRLMNTIDEGVSAAKIENLADILIKKEGGSPSFKMVPGYSWATCVNVNEGLVHGIPKESVVFKKGDIVSVDVGMCFEGFHTDASFTVGILPTKEVRDFLDVGRAALKKAISEAYPGNKIYDISKAIQTTLRKNKLYPIKALVGHGVGKNLHEVPQIPCFIKAPREKTLTIPEGAVLAIEVMYTKGLPEVKVENDGWTISTKDGKITGFFEETVAVTGNGPIVLTEMN